MQREVSGALKEVFEGDEKILAAYLFGSKARGTNIEGGDVDVAVFLSATPENLLATTCICLTGCPKP